VSSKTITTVFSKTIITNSFLLIVIITIVLSFACNSYAQVVSGGDLSYVMPAASRFVRITKPFPHYLGYSSEGGCFMGVVFLTTEVTPDESWGYRDQIATLVGVNANGVITGIKVISEAENPRYTKGFLDDGSWFLTQFQGMDANDNFILGEDIDVVTGATITSSAISRSINAGLGLVAQEVLSIQVQKDNPVEHLFLRHLLWQIDFMYIWIIVGLAAFAYYTKSALLRYCILGMSFVYFGFLKGGGFSTNDVLTILSFRIPILSNNLYWYSLVIIAIVSAILAGRFYCGWLCPFGIVTEMLYCLMPIKWTINKNTDKYLKGVKYVNLAIILIIAVLLANNTLAVYLIGIVEPFATLFSLHGDLLSWAWLIAMLMCSSVISRFFCRYVCPLGAFFAIIIAISSAIHLRHFNVNLPQENCKGCRRAEKQCQMDAVVYDEELRKVRIDGNECVMCNTCVANCPVLSKRA